MPITISGGVTLSGGVNLAPGSGAAPTPVTGNNQGTNYGYDSTGQAGPGALSTIQKYSYASDGNATNVADTAIAIIWGTGSSSTTSGYVVAGFDGSTY